jgi:hypothetical protein
MNTRKKIILSGIVLSVFLMASNISLAQTAGENIEESGGWSTGIENAGSFGLPDAPVGNIIANIADWIFGIFAFFGVIGFLISGIIYLVSTGDDEMITKAKKYMLYSIIGVIVGLSGYVIILAANGLLNADII